MLPLKNLSDDPEDAFFAEGVAEEITTAISRIDGLRVISRTSVQPFRDSDLPVGTIAERLGVDAVLEGSVRRAGGRVRITAQLIDGRRDDHLWGDSYERRLEDVFAIQSEVARRIASALETTLSPADERRLDARPTVSIPAYDLYLRGQELMERDRVGNETAIELFRESIRLDPDFADAHAGLALAHVHQVELFGAPRNRSRVGIETARRAIAIDPERSSGHYALGKNLETLRRLGPAAAAYRRAVELNPSFADAISALALVSVWAGDFVTAVRSGEQVLGVTPGDPRPFFVLGFAYYCLDRPAEAESWYARALSIWPEFIWAEASLAYFRTVYGRVDEARALTDRILEREPDNWVGLTVSADTALMAGDTSMARDRLERAFAIDPDGRHTGHLRSVAVALGFLLDEAGEKRRGARLLERGVELNQRAIAEGAEFGGIPLDLAAAHSVQGANDEAWRWLERSYRMGW
ncbi:MAG: tetratricopeptide repeat protein, partial [Gemmatimonadota bacterium]|nr:tetratricopeptide repeat protein [Gemmatimonadota bacterium]